MIFLVEKSKTEFTQFNNNDNKEQFFFFRIIFLKLFPKNEI